MAFSLDSDLFEVIAMESADDTTESGAPSAGQTDT
jgi:hypothetical protein